MALNLIKLAVGIESIKQLKEIQSNRFEKEGLVSHYTKNYPKRYTELLDGGSLFWVIKGYIRIRQIIIDIQQINYHDTKKCKLILSSDHILTEAVRRKPHQGWRYLDQVDCPNDLEKKHSKNSLLPNFLIKELKDLGLW